MLKLNIFMKGGDRVIGHFNRIVFNMPKTTNTITGKIGLRVRDEARTILYTGEYRGRHAQLIPGTEYISEGDGKGYVMSQGMDELGHDYGPDVNYGTAPHWQPQRGKMHPGIYKTQGTTLHYFERAIEKVKTEVKPLAEEEVNKTIRRK